MIVFFSLYPHEAARQLGVSLPTIHRWLKQGKLHRLPGLLNTRIAVKEIEALVTARRHSNDQRRAKLAQAISKVGQVGKCSTVPRSIIPS